MKFSFHNSLRALFLSLAVLLSLPMLAVEVEIDGINYYLDAETKEASVCSKSSGKYSGEVVIPESVDHEGIAYSVTSIGGYAFCQCLDLTSVTIPNSVTSIGSQAFDECEKLTSVFMGNGVVSIGDRAFFLCESLSSIDIPDGVACIEEWAFYRCSSLTSVTIPNSVTSIGLGAFGYCLSLTSVTIPNSVTSIGREAFWYCPCLTSITIPNSVTSIGDTAFEDCHFARENFVNNSSLSAEENDYWGAELYDYETENGLLIDNTSVELCRRNATIVTIPNSVTSIGDHAFNGCIVLTSVAIPNSVTSIGNGAFGHCYSLTSVTIPNSVTSIEACTFYSCYSLTSVTIPNSVTSIGEWAFYGCSELLDVYCYAENVPSTESDAFDGSYPEYATLHVPAASIESYKAKSPWSGFGNIVALPPFSGEVEINGINYELNGETKQAIVIAKSSGLYSGEVVIPESVEHQGTTYSVTSIGESAFNDCTGLTSVTIPNSVTSIGDCAFFGCSGLTSVTIPNSVTSIGERAFCGCSGLTSVTIPNSVTSIGDAPFATCSGLTEIKVDANNSKYDSREGCNAIIETYSNTLISACQTTVIPNSVTSIGYGAFAYCSGLTSVTIPNSVTSIGESAFYGCSGLTSVTIPNSVTSIGAQAFYRCSGLTSVTIPNSVTSIGWQAFWLCSSLTSVTIPNSVTSIEAQAFYRCSGLTSVTIPNSVTSIGDHAFNGCSGLQDVYCYAENVPSTKSYAFDNSNYENATLHVPAGSIESYKTTDPWRSFGNIVPLTKEYQLTVSSVGYATLYLDYNAEIPEGVEAYVATEVVDSRLKMQKVEGVLPENTGVIIVAGQGTYTFTESDETPATIEKNLLQGSATNTYVTAEANTTYYVLSAPNGVVAMYQAKLTDNQFLNNAFKAYLPISNGDLGIFDDEVDSSVEQLSRRLVFDFGEEETSIDEVLTTDKSQKTKDIFDLSGRRVQKAQKGIYIQNGKLMVK